MNILAPAPRLAEPDDVEAAVATVVAAFEDDPAWSFILGSGNPRGRQAFARALLIPRIHRATAWVLPDCSAVAMWDRLGEPQSADALDHDAHWRTFRAEVGDEIWFRLQVYDRALDSVGPGRPRWYLGVLATRPDVQGCGRATHVLQPGLAAAHADGWDCWLETSTPGNKSFYAARGFVEATAVDIPGGPPTWWLRRPASP